MSAKPSSLCHLQSKTVTHLLPELRKPMSIFNSQPSWHVKRKATIYPPIFSVAWKKKKKKKGIGTSNDLTELKNIIKRIFVHLAVSCNTIHMLLYLKGKCSFVLYTESLQFPVVLLPTKKRKTQKSITTKL